MVPFILHVYHLGLALGLDSEINIDLTLYCVMRSEIYALATITLTYLSYEILSRSVTQKSCIEIDYPLPPKNVLNATVVSLNVVHVINSPIVIQYDYIINSNVISRSKEMVVLLLHTTDTNNTECVRLLIMW